MDPDPFATLLADAGPAAPHELAELVDRCAVALGADGAVMYLSDLQQHSLMPFVLDPGDQSLEALSVSGSLAGRAFQTSSLQTQDLEAGAVRAWLPLVVGTDRIGVLCVEVSAGERLDAASSPLPDLLAHLAGAAATLVSAKMPYGDLLVRLRRIGSITLAAEIQYGLLPPLSFASNRVSVAAALEPCYNVAGDTIDYAVDHGRTAFGVFDGMGHGLHSAQCASLTVAAYRNARRRGEDLVGTMRSIDAALLHSLAGEAFTTAVLAQLDTDTGRLTWVNAGHPAPLLLRDGKVIKDLYVDPRPPLGLGHLLTTTDVAIGTEQLEPGDRVLVFTDGVVEARSPGGEFFGVERLGELVVRQLAGGLPEAETMRRAVAELLDHQDGQLSDDATLLLLGWPRPAPSPL